MKLHYTNCCVLLASYKHAVDGLYRVIRDEGAVKLMNGATMASSRATLVTIGQVTILFAASVLICYVVFCLFVFSCALTLLVEHNKPAASIPRAFSIVNCTNLH